MITSVDLGRGPGQPIAAALTRTVSPPPCETGSNCDIIAVRSACAPASSAVAGGRLQENAMAEIVVVEASDTLTHVVLRGRLDVTGVGKVEHELAKHTVARRKPAIVDISAVDVLASIGILGSAETSMARDFR